MRVSFFDSLLFPFLLAFLPMLIIPAIFPTIHLTFFAPFLVIVFYRQSFFHSLWISLFCGIIIDTFSSHTRFGLYAVNYCLTTWIVYEQKRHFFEESLSTTAIMTYFFSFISTLVEVILLSIFGHELLLSWGWVGIDLFFMPLVDALYGFCLFTIPRHLIPLR